VISVGVYTAYNHSVHSPLKRRYYLWLLLIGFIAYFLSIGVSSGGILQFLIQRMYDYIPGYIGLREPQKRLALVVILYMAAETRSFSIAYFDSYSLIVAVVVYANYAFRYEMTTMGS
jgi:hypothetical protein